MTEPGRTAEPPQTPSPAAAPPQSPSPTAEPPQSASPAAEPPQSASPTAEPPQSASPTAADVAQRTSMAAERTWLAWWRTALAATAGALGVGRLAPELLDVAPWPYVVLGAGYATLAIGLLLIGALRQRDLERALERGSHAPLSFSLVALFTAGGVALALTTIVLVVAQT